MCTSKEFSSPEYNVTQCFLVISFRLRTFAIISGWNFVYCDPVISPTSSTIFDPTLVRKFIGVYEFPLFVIIFGFPNRLIVVPLSIIVIYPKSDPSFFTCLIPFRMICNPIQTLVFVLDTLASASLSTVCSSPFYIAFL